MDFNDPYNLLTIFTTPDKPERLLLRQMKCPVVKTYIYTYTIPPRRTKKLAVLIMEKGDVLWYKLHPNPPPPPPQLSIEWRTHCIKETAKLVACLASSGIIFPDIKSPNLILCPPAAAGLPRVVAIDVDGLYALPEPGMDTPKYKLLATYRCRAEQRRLFNINEEIRTSYFSALITLLEIAVPEMHPQKPFDGSQPEPKREEAYTILRETLARTIGAPQIISTLLDFVKAFSTEENVKTYTEEFIFEQMCKIIERLERPDDFRTFREKMDKDRNERGAVSFASSGSITSFVRSAPAAAEAEAGIPSPAPPPPPAAAPPRQGKRKASQSPAAAAYELMGFDQLSSASVESFVGSAATRAATPAELTRLTREKIENMGVRILQKYIIAKGGKIAEKDDNGKWVNLNKEQLKTKLLKMRNDPDKFPLDI